MSDFTILRTEWMDIMTRGQRPNPSALRAHLRAVHEIHAGFTERCATLCKDETGRSSYRWLSEAVRPEIDGVLLDVACGSGPLLDLCQRRFSPEMRLIGVDMSSDELDLAQQRLPGGRVELYEGQADAMTALPDTSVDVALCHWALTLMDPVIPVLKEIRRVLKPGGRFAAIVDGPTDICQSYKRVNDIVFSYVEEELPGYGTFDFGDPRVRNKASLIKLINEVFHNSEITVEAGVVSMDGDPHTVAEDAAGFFYASFILSNGRQQTMLADLAKTLETVPSNPALSQPISRFSMPINRIVVDLSKD